MGESESENKQASENGVDRTETGGYILGAKRWGVVVEVQRER